jgi:hypothetical protein
MRTIGSLQLLQSGLHASEGCIRRLSKAQFGCDLREELALEQDTLDRETAPLVSLIPWLKSLR